MAADGSGPSSPGGRHGRGGSGYGPRPGLPAIATMLGFLAAGVTLGMGGGRLQAAGLGLMMLGLTLWLGSLRPMRAHVVDERTRRQRQRSLAIALGLGGLVVIFYVATLVRLGPNALRKDSFADPAKRTIPVNDLSVCKQAGTC